MRIKVIKKSQEKQWQSLGLQRLFSSKDDIHDPKVIRTLFVEETKIIKKLKSFGMREGEDYRLSNGFEYEKDGVLSDFPEIIEEIKTADINVAQIAGSSTSNIKIEYTNPDSDNFGRYDPDNIFNFPSKATKDEIGIIHYFDRKLIDDLNEHGVKLGTDWYIGHPMDIVNLANQPQASRHPLFYRSDDERKIDIFEDFITKYEREVRNAIRSYKQDPNFANILLGEDRKEDMTDAISSTTVRTVMEFMSSSQFDFSQMDWSNLNDEDLKQIGSRIDQFERERGFSFSGLPRDQKTRLLMGVLFDLGLIAGASLAMGDNSDILGEVDSITGNTRKYFDMVDLAKERQVKVPSFSNMRGEDLYSYLVSENDPLKADQFMMEALYTIDRPAIGLGKEHAEMLIRFLVYMIFIKIIREMKNGVEYRPVDGNVELSNEKEKRYNLTVNNLLGSIDKNVFEGFVKDISTDPVKFVQRYPNIDSLKGSMIIGDIRSKVLDYILSR